MQISQLTFNQNHYIFCKKMSKKMVKTKEEILKYLTEELSSEKLDKLAREHFKKVHTELQKITKRVEEKYARGPRRTTGPFKLPL